MAEQAKKSRARGLFNLYVATVTENTEDAYTTSAPVHIGGAIKASRTDNYSTENVYSDNVVEEVISEYSDTEVTLEVSELTPEEQTQLFGFLYQNGYLVRTDGVTAPECALGYATKKANGKVKVTWIYCGRFSDSESQDLQTKEDKVATQTRSLKYSAYPRKKVDTVDGKEHHFLDVTIDEEALLDSHTSAKAALASFFGSVQEPTLTAATV